MDASTIIGIMIVFSLVAAAITLAATLRIVARHRAELREKRWVLRNGMPAKAVIEAIRSTKDQLDDHPVVEVDLTVRTEQGNVFSASLRTAVPAVRLPEFRPGWTINVKYAEIDGRMKVEAADAYVP